MATNSGIRRLVHGTRERILSSDHNREQSFEAAMFADVLRHLYEASALEEQACGVATQGSALASPLRAIVLNGLQVRPELGTFNLFVESGMLIAVDPGSPASPDDSVLQVVRSAGQQVAAALVIGAPGGGVRIDVIECSISQTVIEADNRDVFNPSTGTFTPQLINKVVEAQLTFRVRAGTAGAGWPGVASGWLPLAVARVPSAGASNDDCTFWDVRPLRSDLADHSHRVIRSFPGTPRQHASAIEEGAGNWRARGVVELSTSGWKVGGNLVPSATGATYLDLTSGGPNQESGFTAVASRPWYLWLAQPFGLPRWAQYSPSSSGSRVPLAPRGIPIFSMTGPTGMTNVPSSGLALPTSTGLGNTTTNARVAMAGAFVAGTAFSGCVVGGDGWTRLYGNPGIALSPTSGNNTSSPTYTLAGNVSFPSNASGLRLRFQSTLAAASGTIIEIAHDVFVFDTVGGNIVEVIRVGSGTHVFPADGDFIHRFEVDIALPPNLPTGAIPTHAVQVTYTNVATFSAQTCQVVGWRLGS